VATYTFFLFSIIPLYVLDSFSTYNWHNFLLIEFRDDPTA
jgi:hypothetical protein